MNDISVRGRLLAIFMAANKRNDLVPVQQAELVAGRGLIGDRYFLPEGKSKPQQEVTLIEKEALEGTARDYGITLEPQRSRRNLLTEGVALNHLVGRKFLIGDVLLRGVELCEPCGRLESMTVAGIKKALIHRGGLRAQVLRGGMIRCGDGIQLFSQQHAALS